MSSRWESSRRPLFVRTVWANGHHHAVLFKGDPLGDYRKFSAKERLRIVSSGYETNTLRLKPGEIGNKNLQVSSVQLLLDTISNIKNETKRPIRTSNSRSAVVKTLTFEVLPSARLKLRNLNEEVNITHKHLKCDNVIETKKLSVKSNSFDAVAADKRDNVINKRPYENGNLLTQCFTNNANNQYNYLSERVMVWLDLATQVDEELKKTINDALDKSKLENVNSRKRTVTAHVCSNVQNSINKKVSLNEEQTVKTITIDKAIEIDNEKKTGDQFIPKEKDYSEVNRVNQIMSCEETPVAEITEKLIKPNKCGLLKRQLHIFMPNIPKKNSECDSNLSSKNSSLFKLLN